MNSNRAQTHVVLSLVLRGAVVKALSRQDVKWRELRALDGVIYEPNGWDLPLIFNAQIQTCS